MLPPPPICTMVAMACSMLARLAGTEVGLRKRLLPENSSTLKLSLGRRLPISSRSRALEVSSGKPCMEPEMSTTKMYSRGLMVCAAICLGGSTMARKKFSPLPGLPW